MKNPVRLLIALCLSLLLVVSFVACNPGKNETSSSRPMSEASSKNESSKNSSRPESSSEASSGSLESTLSDILPELSSTPSSSSMSVEGDLSSPLHGEEDKPTQTPVQYPLEGLSGEKITWGPGRGSGHNPPSAPVSLQSQYGAYGAYFLKEDSEQGKTVYLTFDEGYEYGLSDDILDTLKAKGVKAVFFVTMDFVKSNPDLCRRMINEGHTLGNHSTTHPSFPSLSVEKMESEVLTLHNKVKADFGYEMHLMRFPMGEFSALSLRVLQNLGYESVFWSFAYKDWVTDDQPDKTASLKLLCDQLHDGGIYLLHAVSRTNSDILADFIDRAREMGYTFGEWV